MIIGQCPVCGADMRVGSDMTNADRIRAITDEELAEFMVRTGTEYSCPPPHYFGKNEYCQKHLPNCKGCWLDWLKQESGEC